jgi:hypothetical protein
MEWIYTRLKNGALQCGLLYGLNMSDNPQIIAIIVAMAA